MKRYTLTMSIEIDDEDAAEIGSEEIRSTVYESGGDWPFSFDITSVEER
jgi:hypothetical protein